MKMILAILSGMFALTCLSRGRLVAQGAEDAPAETSEREALEREMEVLKTKLELYGIAVEMLEKGDREANKLLFGRPRVAGPQTPLLLRVLKLCSSEGILPHLFTMLHEMRSTPMKEAIVFGIFDVPNRPGVIEGFEAILSDPDTRQKYVERVRFTVATCLMQEYLARGIQPSESLVERMLESNESSGTVAASILQELGQFGRQWHSLLSTELQSENRDVRFGAMEGLQNLYVRGEISRDELASDLQRLVKAEPDEIIHDLAILMYGTHLKGEKHEDLLYVTLRTEESDKTARRAAYVLMSFAENRDRVFAMLEKSMYDLDNPCTQEAAIWAVSIWPDNRKKAIEAIDKLRKEAAVFDRKEGLDVWYDESKPCPEGGHRVPYLQIVDDTLSWRLRYAPDQETIAFLRRLLDETPFESVKCRIPYRMVECMQDEETEKLLKELIFHHPSAWVCYAAVKSYSILKGMEADEFLKQVVVESKLALRQEQAIKALGDRGYWYGPRCKALETLKALQKQGEYEESVRKALVNAIDLAGSYKPENWQKLLDDIDKEEGYWLTVRSNDLGPNSYAVKSGMQSEYIRRHNKALLGLYGKFFALDWKETLEGGHK